MYTTFRHELWTSRKEGMAWYSISMPPLWLRHHPALSQRLSSQWNQAYRNFVHNPCLLVDGGDGLAQKPQKMLGNLLFTLLRSTSEGGGEGGGVAGGGGRENRENPFSSIYSSLTRGQIGIVYSTLYGPGEKVQKKSSYSRINKHTISLRFLGIISESSLTWGFRL